MPVNNTTSGPEFTGKRGGRLRMIGIVVLLVGLGIAGVVYWTGSPSADLSDDVATAQTSKRAARDIEMNFGKMGLMMSDWMEDLQHPGTQAGIIAVVSMLAASGCFYFAHLLEHAGEPDAPVDKPVA
jgi:hypothetical protein